MRGQLINSKTFDSIEKKKKGATGKIEIANIFLSIFSFKENKEETHLMSSCNMEQFDSSTKETFYLENYLSRYSRTPILFPIHMYEYTTANEFYPEPNFCNERKKKEDGIIDSKKHVVIGEPNFYGWPAPP